MAAFIGEEAMSALVEAGLAQQLKKGRGLSSGDETPLV